MTRFQRHRREVAPVLAIISRPLFRYSYSRDAYVLRVVGAKHGPVLKRRPPEPPRFNRPEA